jgi:hypothetical protein
MDANLFSPSMEVFTSSGSEVCACATESNETRDIDVRCMVRKNWDSRKWASRQYRQELQKLPTG